MNRRLNAAPGELPEELRRRVEELAGEERPVLVAVDGGCGSGKTALGLALGRAFGCPVVHTDDYYLPFDRRLPNWNCIPAANMDFARLRTEVLDPLRAGRDALCRPYNCHAGQFGPATPLPGGGLVVLEGSYSHHPLLGAYDLTVFVTCPPPCRARRLQEREGENYGRFVDCWIPLEEGYFSVFAVEEKADFVLDTGTQENS